MFDVGFGELVVIGVIAVVVVGPDKLPEVVRTSLKFVRKARRMFNDVKNDVERELDIDEMRQYINDNEVSKSLKQIKSQVDDINSETHHAIADIDHEVRTALEEEKLAQTPPASKPSADDAKAGEKTQASAVENKASAEAAEAPVAENKTAAEAPEAPVAENKTATETPENAADKAKIDAQDDGEAFKATGIEKAIDESKDKTR